MAKKPVRGVTSVSVPADLKRRMDKVKEAVNWSALACQAFESKLAEIAKNKETKTMEDVIARLRESNRADEDGVFKAGFGLGQEWAKKAASAAELKRLAKASELETWDRGLFDDNSVYDHHTVAERLFFVLRPEDDDCHRAEAFWEKVDDNEDLHEERITDSTFVRGFAEGALDVWDKVKNAL